MSQSLSLWGRDFGIHWTGGNVSHRTVVNDIERKNLASSGTQTTSLQLIST
jgi:hypothetical protein